MLTTPRMLRAAVSCVLVFALTAGMAMAQSVVQLTNAVYNQDAHGNPQSVTLVFTRDVTNTKVPGVSFIPEGFGLSRTVGGEFPSYEFRDVFNVGAATVVTRNASNQVIEVARSYFGGGNPTRINFEVNVKTLELTLPIRFSYADTYEPLQFTFTLVTNGAGYVVGASKVQTAKWFIPVVELIASDNETGKNWPEPGAITLRRSNQVGELTVNFSISGSAIYDTDYHTKGAVYAFDIEGLEVKVPDGNGNLIPINNDHALRWYRPWGAPGRATFRDGVTELVIDVVPSTGGNPTATREAVFTLQNGTDYVPHSTKNSDKVTILGSGLITKKEAVRFLNQAAFGPGISRYRAPGTSNFTVVDDISLVQQLGFEGWIDWQLSINNNRNMTQMFIDYIENSSVNHLISKNTTPIFWSMLLGYDSPAVVINGRARAPRTDYDPLRQRMAWAMSQIFVISFQGAAKLGRDGKGLTHYYDNVLRKNAFGNFRDTLRDVTYHPTMGYYLSHVNNRKKSVDEQGEILTEPDENFAREILQLFSIGVYELNANGQVQMLTTTDSYGNEIRVAKEAYDNDHITNFARIFTGLTYADPNNPNQAGRFGQNSFYFESFMKGLDHVRLVGNNGNVRLEEYHDIESKSLLTRSSLNRFVDASSYGAYGSSAVTDADIAKALDNITSHPNVGPYMARLLIQRFVTSNPSAGYVRRVGDVITANKYSGTEGWPAILKAILLDHEARSYSAANRATAPSLREPILRLAHLARTFRARPKNLPATGMATGWMTFPDQIHQILGQGFLASPSVFNFYSPDFIPPHRDTLPDEESGRGPIFGPEFQISSDNMMLRTLNAYSRGFQVGWAGVEFDYTDLKPLAHDPDALLRYIDLHLCAGRLLPSEKAIIASGIRQLRITRPQDAAHVDSILDQRVMLALSMVSYTPAFNVAQ